MYNNDLKEESGTPYVEYYRENVLNESRDEVNDNYNRDLNEIDNTPEISSTPKIDSAINNLTSDDKIMNLIENVHNPKREEFNRDKYERENRMKELGIKELESNFNKDKFNEFVNDNENFLENMKYIREDGRYNDIIPKALNRVDNLFSKEDEKRGKLIPLNDGYGIELPNGEIIYTDKSSQQMKNKIDRENKRNNKLLQDEYNNLIKRQEKEEKEKIKNEILEEREKENILNNFSKNSKSGLIRGASLPFIIDGLNRLNFRR